jgi:replicative DNA helicase
MEQHQIAEIEAEIIHSCLFDTSESERIFTQIRPHHFRLNGNARKVYEMILEERKRTRAAGQLFENLVSRLTPFSDLWEYVYGLDSKFWTTSMAPGQIRALIEIYNSKQIETELDGLQDSTLSSQDKVSRMTDLAEKFTIANEIQTANTVENYQEVLHNLQERKMGEIIGHGWGVRKLDQLTGGIELGKLYTFGGLKKAGKTRFMVNIIHSLFNQNITCLLFSLEMNAYSMQQLFVSRFAEITTDIFRHRIEYDESKLANTISLLVKNHSRIKIVDTPGLNDFEIREQIKKAKSHGVQVVFIDYLQRMSIPDIDNRAYALQSATARLADTARRENIAIIFLSQLAQRAEGRIAGIADLKESGGIGENVDCAILLTNKDRIRENVEGKKTNEMIAVIEQRAGESGFLKMKADLATCRFWGLDEIHEN